MNRTILFAAASSLALAAFVGGAQGQGKATGLVGADGKPCAGVLDDEKNCLDASVVKNSPDRPYRGKPYDAKTYEPSQMPHFVRKGQELIYLATPGGESDDHDSTRYNAEGIIVLDPATNYAYISTRGHLIALDLATDKIVWSKTYDPINTCCERGAVTPDGLTLEVGSNLQNFHRVIDARTGDLKGIIPTPASPNNHNMVMSPDGKTVIDAPNGVTVTVASMETMKPIKTITFSD